MAAVATLHAALTLPVAATFSSKLTSAVNAMSKDVEIAEEIHEPATLTWELPLASGRAA